jgi:peptidoglycan hydrolase-like protein with peptidoglycan-binding domain
MNQMLKTLIATFAIFAMLCTGAFAQEKTGSINTHQSSEKQSSEKIVKTRVEYLPETIEKAQQVLKTKGLYKGDVTGKMNPTTREAVKTFQEKEGLNPTGRLNKDTRQKLGIETIASNDSAKSSSKRRAKSDNGQSGTMNQ